ncbi:MULTISPECIES: MerR family transcriptional regulator [Streptomyces]|uniref:MerR family transcriptional regulator n=2 Tax=Streptomyces TaxID=1883 RepID=A0A100Y081_9ACTN|nr:MULTISPECIES: MerR family transcriptional regulator [Streptomyces]KUH35294.1 MerR family transcriptional regulator [Streptomyces kanasensis]UUS32124.1 MerR family transcriptional regulator [Streptomyces changanensis]
MAPGARRSTPADNLDDDDYPAYSMGRAAELIGTSPAFLRALGEAGLITPPRSGGGHRRYSRRQLRMAARARELVDQGTPVEAACRIIVLEDDLAEALRINDELRRDDPEDTGPGDGAGPGEGAGPPDVSGSGDGSGSSGAGPGD